MTRAYLKLIRATALFGALAPAVIVADRLHWAQKPFLSLEMIAALGLSVLGCLLIALPRYTWKAALAVCGVAGLGWLLWPGTGAPAELGIFTRRGLEIFCAGGFAAILAAGFGWTWLRRREGQIEALAEAQADWIDRMAPRWTPLLIFASAAVSLYLQLAFIRWQTTVMEFFSFYKNLSLLACFAGLGIGYALAGRREIPLLLSIPLCGLQIAWVALLRDILPQGLLNGFMLSPISEQLNMGYSVAYSSLQYFGIYLLLSVTFFWTALIFVPIGQVCGRAMTREESLKAYGLNLAGSLAGSAAAMAQSFFYTTPVVWFGIAFLTVGLMVPLAGGGRGAAWIASFATLALLGWPIGQFTHSEFASRVYSPYQMIELTYGEPGYIEVRASGFYYQRVFNLAADNANRKTDPGLDAVGRYYEFPYAAHPPAGEVLIVGAGTGNDVAAALRMGATRVDAVEIDPAIQEAGRRHHPEQPYSDPRVTAIVDDARSHFRTTERTYDLIVYGLLDSHSLLGNTSSGVRLDSFVYTVEGLREARQRLKPGGALSLSFCVATPELGRKIYLMIQEAFDGQAPVCIEARYDRSIVYLVKEGGEVKVPPGLLAQADFIDMTEKMADPAIITDVSTDDWPFFYMPRRVYPFSYLGVLALIVLLTAIMLNSFAGERPALSHASFFLLGAGFMLVETKNVTELALTFGNTWHVVGFVIIGILSMAFLGNLFVRKFGPFRPHAAFALLIASLVLGMFLGKDGGLGPSLAGKAATLAVLASPIFFSGIAFSTLLAASGNVVGAMSMNVLGAVFGGILEYNSMYFGFRFLYILAMALYLAAYASLFIGRGKSARV